MSTAAAEMVMVPERVQDYVRRVVDAVDPEEVIAFGSRARGEARPDSDLDLAVIVGGDETAARKRLHAVRHGLLLGVDVLVFSREHFDEMRPWRNTVQREIDLQGVRLYERGKQPVDRTALERICKG